LYYERKLLSVNHPYKENLIMKYTIHVGSENPVKLAAVEECLQELHGIDFSLSGIDVDSQVNEQTQSFTETIEGATNRAQTALQTADFAIGLEDGIFQIPGQEGTYMNICACVITNGTVTHHGCSSAFEYPQDITDLVLSRGLDISEALGAAGYTGNPGIGAAEGAIGILSEGRLIRKDYTKQAVNAALIHLKNFIGE
jgi:inosine/xanthosine triphosphatase